MPRVLVSGATSIVGRQVVQQLREAGAEVRALTRDPQRAGLPADVEVYRGDLTQPDSLELALAGVDAVFLVWTVPVKTVDAVVRRISENASRIVYLSAPIRTPHPFFQQPNPLRDICERVEEAVDKSGVKYTFVRPGIFAANSLRWWVPQIRTGNTVRWPYAHVETAPIHERDIAAVAVRALCEDTHASADYVVTGPESLTQSEQVAIIGKAIGRSLVMQEISPDNARRELTSILPPFIIEMLMNAWVAAADQPAFVTSTVREVTGLPATTFADWTNEHASEFRQVN